jgi:hypothetical protein
MPQNSNRRCQFRLLELFVLVTVSAVAFAWLRRWGMRGFYEQLTAAVFIGSVVTSVMAIHYRIKHNLGL